MRNPLSWSNTDVDMWQTMQLVKDGIYEAFSQLEAIVTISYSIV